MKRELIPVILAHDLKDFKAKLSTIQSFKPKPDMIQIDIVDGKFAPWTTFRNAKKATPLLKKVNYEMDLMVVDPLKHAKAWIKAGAKRILFHIEPKATKDPLKVIKYVKSNKCQIGISINAKTPLSKLFPYIKYVDCVLLLGVDPGKSGQPFQTHTLKKIQILRKKFPTLPIEVDGGVDLKNAAKITKAGANRLASASAILKSTNPQKTYKEFLKIIKK